MKKTVTFVIAAILIIAAIFLSFESIILVSVAKNGIKHILKVRTHMDKIALRPLKGSMAIKGFKIFNPGHTKQHALTITMRIN